MSSVLRRKSPHQSFQTKMDTTFRIPKPIVHHRTPKIPPKQIDYSQYIPKTPFQPDEFNLELFLESINLDQYLSSFLKHGFLKLEECATLSDDDLKMIGVNKLGHRRRILIHLERYKKALLGK